MRAAIRTLSRSLVAPHPYATRALSTSASPFFAAPSASRRSEAAAPPPEGPPLTDGEKELKVKLEGALEGANVQVQDVSGARRSLPPRRWR